MTKSVKSEVEELSPYIPDKIGKIRNPQTELPRLAKDSKVMNLIESAVRRVPTKHELYLQDARRMSSIKRESIHLIVTSPPYWTLKQYREMDCQLGIIGEEACGSYK